MVAFNGDGRTNAVEAALGCRILDEMDREEDGDNDFCKEYDENR